MNMFHYVYVLQNRNKELRTGYTLNLARQLTQHNQEEPKSWQVVYCEAYPHLSDAMRRAEYLKSIHGVKLIKQRLKSYLRK